MLQFSLKIPRREKHMEPGNLNFMHAITDQFADGNWLQLSFKKAGSEKMIPEMVRSNFFEAGLEKKICRRSSKYAHSYVCPQVFSYGSRTGESLYALHNIVVDVDCHSARYCKDLRNSKLDILENLLTYDAFSDYGLPLPNYIVHTGRGLQIWWRHEPMAANKCKNTWVSIVKCFVEIIRKIIAGHSGPEMDVMESLDGLEVDEQASTNAAGLFRIPGTYNPAAKSFSYLHECMGAKTMYSYQELRRFRDEYRAEYPIVRKKPQFKRHYQVPGYDWDISEWAESMSEKIEKLRDLRDDDIGNETRNNFCFILYCLYLSEGMDSMEASRRVIAFNEGFKKPMTMRELKSSLTTAGRKKYKYGTPAIIDLLDISKEEADKIDLKYPATDKNGDENRPKTKKEAVEERNKEIIHLYKTTDMTQEEVAKKVGISRKTAGKVLREAGVSRSERKAKKIQSLNEKGNSVEQIARKTGRSGRTVYRVIKNTAGKNAGGAPEAAQINPETASKTNADAAVSISAACAAQREETVETAMPVVTAETPAAESRSLAASEGTQDLPEQAGAENAGAAVKDCHEAAFDKMSPVQGNNGYLIPVRTHTSGSPPYSSAALPLLLPVGALSPAAFLPAPSLSSLLPSSPLWTTPLRSCSADLPPPG